MTARSLSTIAREIRCDWRNVSYGAKPYLDAMLSFDAITGQYGCDSAESSDAIVIAGRNLKAHIVACFLANTQSWRGDTAERIKAELKALGASGRKSVG